jgi:hypothetical protein
MESRVRKSLTPVSKVRSSLGRLTRNSLLSSMLWTHHVSDVIKIGKNVDNRVTFSLAPTPQRKYIFHQTDFQEIVKSSMTLRGESYRELNQSTDMKVTSKISITR